MTANIRKGPVVVFHDPGYPHVYSEATLAELVPGKFQIADAANLAVWLERGGVNLLLSFHGPYFPKQAWTAILRFLQEAAAKRIYIRIT